MNSSWKQNKKQHLGKKKKRLHNHISGLNEPEGQAGQVHCGFCPLADCRCHSCGSREGWDICLCRKWLCAFGMTEPQQNLLRAPRFTTRGKNLKLALGWNLLQLKNKKNPQAKGSKEEANKGDIFWEMRSMFFIRKENLALLLFPPLDHVSRVASGIGLDRQLDTLNIQSGQLQASRQALGSPPLNTKAQITLRKHHFKGYTQSPNMWPLLRACQARQRHRNHMSVTASYTWLELHTRSLFDMTAATKPHSPAKGSPAPIEIHLHSSIIGYSSNIRSRLTFDHILQK